MIRLFLLAGLSMVGPCVAEVQQSLNSIYVDGWTVTNSNGSIQIPGTVPGGIYSDLQKAEILDPNLFYRFNDIDYRWVGYDNWTYSLTFEVSEEIFTKSNVNLVFLGLDTVGNVYLNDELVGSFSNMFIQYILPVKDYLQEGSNSLRLEFVSPVLAALANREKQAASYEIPPECTPSNAAECYIPYLRKMQSSFSWDWGPAFPSVGLWKSAWLEGYDTVVVRDIIVNVVHNLEESVWETHIQAFGIANGNVSGTLELDVGFNAINGNHVYSVTMDTELDPNITLNTYQLLGEINVNLPESIAELWWPNGYGNQTLSNVTVSFISSYNDEVSQKSVNFGLRTIRLVQDQIDPDLDGTSFYFEVNNLPVFAKGSNWIPSHILPELGYEESRIRHLLTSAKEVHQNMIRVWGGGVYESDLFYQIADELGIMIWQDFMFASALYPADDEFLANVAVEVEQQVRRLQHHACVALWSGNNEDVVVLRWWPDHANYSRFYDDYVKLFVDTIKPIVLNVDSTRSFVTSSPSNGVKTDREDDDPGSGIYGDIHYYNYGGNSWDSSTFPHTRFASEYGYQSLPEYKTMVEVSTVEDRILQSEFSQARQHHPDGYNQMANLMNTHLPLGDDDSTEEYYKKYIYFGQISHAMSIKTETEKYRTCRNETIRSETTLQGQAMGALYWQLNDVWQAPTWSSIDFDGNWKMVHFFAKKFFAPILASPRSTSDGKLLIHITSDLSESRDVNLTVRVQSYEKFQPLDLISEIYTVEPASSLVYTEYNLTDLLTVAGCPIPVTQTCFIYMTMSDPLEEEIYPDNYFFPSSLTDAIGLTSPDAALSCQTMIDGTLEFHLRVTHVTPFVWFETDVAGRFSDNGFHIVDDKSVVLEFYPRFPENVTICGDIGNVTVRSVLGQIL